MVSMESRYDPAAVEPLIAARWNEAGAFSVSPDDPGEPYVIAVPPPNITGSLHMGHALNLSIQDALIRHQRMRGRKALWICGTDHAGIATQNVVEKQLRDEGLTRFDLGREAFIRGVWEWRAESGGTILEQFRRLGCSLDYANERFTMDEGYARAVARVFVALHAKGLLYRANRMINWCTRCATAISDLEVEHHDLEDVLYEIDYELADGSGVLTVATVRPATLLGDSGVAVNPADARFAGLVGGEVIVPLVDRHVPIVADEHVEVGFGTGALKVTPAHDPNDFEIGRRHGLEEITVIGFDGRMTEAAGHRYAGLSSEEAHQLVLADLRERGLVRAERPLHHSVGHCSRCGTRVEPLVSLQWFCDMEQLAAPATAAVRDGRVRFHPKGQERIFFEWMDAIRPWCVSRQLWWGHQLPVWYCSCGETIVQEREPVACPTCGSAELRRDEDVLDTWFSSALWPFATLGWPDETPRLAAFYPGHVLVTARDIINLWVARMLMTGIEFAGGLPFTEVVINSTIQAPDGRRMSKSLGTGIDPLELIAEHGADATRYGLLKMGSSQDVRFSAGAIEEGRGLCTKLWNAARLILTATEPVAGAPVVGEPIDAWMLGRLDSAVAEITDALERFDCATAVKALYRFAWNDVCDWYLEAAKLRLYGDDPEAKLAVSQTLRHVLDRTLRLAHPFLPHLSEAIWAELGERELLAAAVWPARGETPPDAEAERSVTAAIELIVALRRTRAENDLKPRAELTVGAPAGLLGSSVELVRGLGHATVVDGLAEGRVPVLIADVPVTISGAGLAEALRPRLEKRLADVLVELERAERKLADERFVSRAPAALVEAERAKAEGFRREVAEVQAHLDELQ